MRAFGGLFAGVLCSVVFACVGEDPDPSATQPSPDGGGPDDSGATSCPPGKNACGGKCVAGDDIAACGASCTPCIAPPNGSVSCDGTCKVACNGGYAVCGNTCANLDLDASHCGRCGRSCNGLACDAKRCATQKVGQLSGATSLVVGASEVFARTINALYKMKKDGSGPVDFIISSADGWDFPGDGGRASTGLQILGTSLFFDGVRDSAGNPELGIFKYAGGANGPTLVKSLAPPGPNTSIAVGIVNGAETYFWVDAYRAKTCTGSCASTVIDVPSDNGLHGTFHKDYWFFTASSGDTVRRCAVGGCGNTADVFVKSTKSKNATIIRAHKDNVYWLDVDTGHPDKARILTCPVTGCLNDEPKVLVKGELEVMEGLGVDDSGVYFTVRGNDNSPTGTVKVCHDLVNGCGTSSEILSSAQPQPGSLVIDDKFAYWIARGGSAGIYRVPK